MHKFDKNIDLPTIQQIEYINSELVDLMNKCKSIDNPETELQYSFNNTQFNVLMSFYFQACSLVLWNEFSNSKIANKTGAFDKYLNGMTAAIQSPESIKNFKNRGNRSLLIDSWSMFETTITQLCEQYITGKLRDDFLFDSDNYNKVNTLVGDKLDDSDKTKLRLKFKLNKISAQSIEKRYRKLYELFFEGDYKENFTEELAFLKFYLTLRNCMHHNFIYLNKEYYSYTFEGIKIEFINKEPIKFTPDVPYTFFFNSTLKLINITNDLFVLIDKKSNPK